MITLTVEKIALPPMKAVTELPGAAPVTANKPVHPLPESIAEPVKPKHAIPASELITQLPSFEKIVIETAVKESSKPSRTCCREWK
jgi:hypothetical protein